MPPSLTGEGGGRGSSAQFDADPQDAYRGAALDSVFAGRLPYVNRLRTTSLGKTQQWEGVVTYDLFVRTPWLRNNLRIYGSTAYSGRVNDSWSHYDLTDQLTRDFRRQFSTAPSTGFISFIRANYDGQKYKHFSYDVDYGYEKSLNTGEYNLYRLDKLGGEWADPALPLTGGDGEGLLPSMSDWRTLSIDAENSYNSRRNQDSHTLAPSFKFFKKGVTSLTLKPGYQRVRVASRDTRSQLPDRRVLRHYNFFQPEASFRYFWKPRLGHGPSPVPLP